MPLQIKYIFLPELVNQIQNGKIEEGNSNMGRKKNWVYCNILFFPAYIFLLLQIIYEWI